MKRYIKEQVLGFQNDISSIEKENPNINLDEILNTLNRRIKENTERYFKSYNHESQEEIKLDLIRDYNLIYYYQAKKNGISKAYLLDDDIDKLPDIYLVEQRPERFRIDEDLLNNINLDEGLTMEQAIELLRWSVNNTRDNLIITEKRRPSTIEDVYGNSSLMGACGLSQFSSLYPLQKLGLQVTINNVGEVHGGRHAYGTVVIPIKMEDKIVNKRFLIDCTYRQFFTIPWNVIARYLSSSPFAGFYVVQDNVKIEFAKELLKNGFIEASLENLEKYLKPFFSGSIPIDKVSTIDEEFSKLDIIDILENKQEEFDYSEEEFYEWGLNLNLPQAQERNL